MEIKADEYESIVQLVREYEKNWLHIPPIQRGKVWTTEHLYKLLVSIHSGFPIGTVFIWDELNKGSTLDYDDEVIPKSYILDGQQRISALHTLIFKKDQTPKIRLKDLYFNHVQNEVHMNKQDKSGESTFMPVSDLTDENGIFLNEDQLKIYFRKTKAEAKSISNTLSFINKIQNATVPKVVVKTEQGSKNDYKQIASLFVTINRSSKLLTNNEIVMAKLVAHMRGISNEFDKILNYLSNKTNGFYPKKLSTSERENIKQWVIALLSVFCSEGQKYHTPRNAVLLDEIYLDKLNENFSRTSSAIHAAIDELRAAKITKSSMLPHSSFIVVLSYMLSKYKGKLMTSKDREALRRFIYVGILSKVFLKNNPEAGTRIVASTNSVEEAVNLILNERIFANNSSVDDFLPLNREHFINRRYNSGYGANILAVTKAVYTFDDWATCVPLSHESNSTTLRMEDHHIFPKKQLKLVEVTNINEVDALANIAIISGNTNNSIINDKLPANYMAKVSLEHQKQQFIPNDPTFLEGEGYYYFLEERGEIWAKALNKELKIPTRAPSADIT